MNKTMKVLAIIGISISCGATVAFSSHAIAIQANASQSSSECIVDFFNNYLREDFTLSNGTQGKGNNLLYKTINAAKGSTIQKPEDPIRKNYEFQGWYKETSCANEWNFASDTVQGNTRLFAKWGHGVEEQDPEPSFTPPSTVLEDSAATDYVIKSVMNFVPNESNQIKVSTSALMKLEANASNVLPLMEYKVKAGKTITATYESSKITITCGSNIEEISVKDNSLNLAMENSSYETKAKNYEAKALEEDSYHVMLAGSSSIEFWTSSKEDLMPVVSYNHGIGGTTIEEWTEKLNQRLVYPYKPKMVVYYVGINNVINSKQDATTIWNNLEAFFDETHAAMPDTKVQYIMMNLIPGYSSYFNVINTVNSKVIEYQRQNTWLTLINPGLSLLKPVEGIDGILKPGDVVNMKCNIELSAVWEDGEEQVQNKFTVSFNGGDGTGEMQSVEIDRGSYTLPYCSFTAPKEKAFIGWKINGNGRIYATGEKINLTDDIELVAVWEIVKDGAQTYQVRLNANGGSNEAFALDEIKGQYRLPKSPFTAPEGKHFAGWKVYGDPNAAYFRTDGLHLSYYGYVVWGGIIKDSILKGLTNN